jgi:hypothetical protein
MSEISAKLLAWLDEMENSNRYKMERSFSLNARLYHNGKIDIIKTLRALLLRAPLVDAILRDIMASDGMLPPSIIWRIDAALRKSDEDGRK